MYAWNDNDPADSNSLIQHMSRGTQGLVLVETEEVQNDLENAKSFTFLQRDVSKCMETTHLKILIFKLYLFLFLNTIWTYVCKIL